MKKIEETAATDKEFDKLVDALRGLTGVIRGPFSTAAHGIVDPLCESLQARQRDPRISTCFQKAGSEL